MRSLQTSKWFLLFALLVPGLAAQDDAAEEYEQLLASGQRKLLAGRLLEAEQTFEELFEYLVEDEVDESDRFYVGATVGLQSIELRRGDYARAERGLQRLPAVAQSDPDVVWLRAECRRRQGAYQEAAALLRQLVERDPSDARARYQLGAVLAADGARADALELWRANAALDPDTEDAVQLAFVGRSLYELGGRENYERASRLFVDSMRIAPERPEARTALGQLKYDAYGEAAGFPSGERDLKKVLDVNGDDEAALLALYRIRSANMVLDGSKTEAFLSRVLDRNPRCVAALLHRAVNVLNDRRFEEAARRLDDVLKIDPNHLETLCHRAAAAMLLNRSEEYAALRARATRGDAGWPDCDRIVGEHLASVYRFADSVAFFEAALALDPDDVLSMHGLAKSLFYCGQGARAKALLERAQEVQKAMVNPWRNNAIAVQELLEEEYEAVEAGPFTMLLHKEDSEVLRAYLLPIHIEAVEVLGKKYGWQPEGKTTVEVFHTWDDFSVRTIGFRGFTALGACFGRLITLVSPVDVDLRRQDFMWEATAWHEYTHVLTLGVSKNRVPRWLTEGFSVYEERARDTSWERGMDRELFDAFHNSDIPPVRLMNRLFRGPRILFGYYQGGLIVELVAKRYGFDKALELLRAFGDDLGIEQAFDRALGMSSRAFDRELLRYIEDDLLRGIQLVQRFDPATVGRLMAAARADARNLDARVDLAWAGLQQDNPVDAGRWLSEVLRQEPRHPEGMLVRAEMLRRRGQLEAAKEHYELGFGGGADDFDSRIRCGEVLLELGAVDEAIEMFGRAKACWPSCTEQATAPELRIAAIYRGRGDQAKAQAEMKAFVRRTARAFAPRFTLAEFERDAGDRAAELKLLRECNRIDPFYRELHVRMAAAYEALGRDAEAARELEVAAAVRPAQDRAYMGPQAEAPAEGGAEELAVRGGLWLRAAKLRHELGDEAGRDGLIERVLQEAPDAPAAAEARELQQKWRR
ncbi:MAG: tetratricopeptide repeat protein [Planctomycetota bacterium]|nr:tetratricopeptide repeat protein [Planctomycetota bacterium]